MGFVFSNYKGVFKCYPLAHLMGSPATKGTVCIACLLGRSLKPDSAWVDHRAGKKDH